MLILANWKAYVEDLDKAKNLLTVTKRLAKRSGIELGIAPPAPFFGHLALARPGEVLLGAQDVSATTGGARTGEETASAYASAGAIFSLVGHSERRAAGDTDALVAEKISHIAACKLTPILCVGERARDPEGRYLSFVRDQIESAFAPLPPKVRGAVTVAYEPIWAIGKTAADALPAQDLNEMVLYIRKVLAQVMSGAAARRARILYGGSVEAANARDLAAASGVDGFLVGHASADPASFTELVTAVS